VHTPDGIKMVHKLWGRENIKKIAINYFVVNIYLAYNNPSNWVFNQMNVS